MKPANSHLRDVLRHTLCLLTAFYAAESAAAAGLPNNDLKTLAGYQPTILLSNDAALSIYQTLPTPNFKRSSGCFQRAHFWSYQLYRQNHIESMKVFLFFTARYQREFGYEWMYHVAPLIPVQQSGGAIEDLVFDPTFVDAPSWANSEDAKRFAHRPITISEWTKYFIFPNTECPVVDRYEDYFDFQERYYCYVIKTPMYTYIPENIETETEVRTSWLTSDLDQMEKALVEKKYAD